MDDARTSLQTAYTDLGAVAARLTEADSWQPSGCTGWAVRDLLLHHLDDAQRGLVVLATASPDGHCDRDAITYWTDSPGRSDPESPGLRATRTIASAYRLDALQTLYQETLQAVVALSWRVEPSAVAPTQGHTMRVGDLLVTEATVHHLDLVIHLAAPGPSAGPLSVVRRTLDGLLGRPAPAAWDDTTWALIGTGRRELSPDQRAILGEDVNRFPLLC